MTELREAAPELAASFFSAASRRSKLFRSSQLHSMRPARRFATGLADVKGAVGHGGFARHETLAGLNAKARIISALLRFNDQIGKELEAFYACLRMT